MARKTKQEFIEEAQQVHGDRFDYSEVEYVNTHTPVKIKCGQCGLVFLQEPSSHLADKVFENREFSILKYYVAQCEKQIGSIHGPGRSEISHYWNQELMNAQKRAREVRRNRTNGGK